jgi:hypothetical protein
MIKDAIARADEMQINAWRADCGATLVDMGLACPGSWKAGQVFVEAGFGGLGKATYGAFDLDPFCLPTIEVWVDHPVIAVVASQAGCWELGEGQYAEIGSGPARAVALSDRWSGADTSTGRREVVVQLQTLAPQLELCRFVADACHVRLNRCMWSCPTACLMKRHPGLFPHRGTGHVKLFLRLRHPHCTPRLRHRPRRPLTPDEGKAMGNQRLPVRGATTVLYADAPTKPLPRWSPGCALTSMPVSFGEF